MGGLRGGLEVLDTVQFVLSARALTRSVRVRGGQCLGSFRVPGRLSLVEGGQ